MMRRSSTFAKLTISLVLITLATLLAACGGNSSSSGNASSGSAPAASSDNNAPAIATMPVPVGNFKAHADNQITGTTPVSTTQVVSQSQTAAASADDLARGNRSYVKNKCADCHGAKGEVVAGKTTKAIGGTTLAADQFDQFLRTGGGLGNDHIFGPATISPGGMAALYAYVKSLPGK